MKNQFFRGLIENFSVPVDATPLADGLVPAADFDKTGVNQNAIVVGSTGCGKTTSVTEAKLLHTFNMSMVVPIAKRIIAEKYKQEFAARGYEVNVIDFADASKSTVGYDPMDYIKSPEDALELAKQMVESEKRAKNYDPYWDNTATALVAGVILLVKFNAESSGTKPKFSDAVKLLRQLEYKQGDNEDLLTINIMNLFEAAEQRDPDNPASEMIRTVASLPARTAQCVYSTYKACMDNSISESVMDILERDENVRFDSMGDKKSLLFVVTNPFNQTCSRFVNIMYSQMFKCFFEKAEASPYGHLDVPVHVICDDFACGTRIMNFENYISIFRQAGISVTILLQSESQLKSLYDEHAATTILNNADTYIFMGSLDDMTVKSVSRRMNLPYDRVINMPLESVMVKRRGCIPYIGHRYSLYEDPLYKKMISAREERKAAVTENNKVG